MKTTAEVIVEYLREAGIGYIFGYPGDPNLDIMEAARRRGVDYVLARREGTAAFMADAFGQLTGLPGVCMSTLGPGSTNLVNGVAGALLDRTPMIAISGAMATRRESIFTHQNVEPFQLFGSITKWTSRFVPESAGPIMRKALRIATAERPGPVHLSAAGDVVAAEAGDDSVALPPMRPAAHASQVYTRDGKDPMALLEQARHPILLSGIATMRSDAGSSLVRLSEQVGIPVVVSPKSKGTFPETHPYFAGTIDMACHQNIWAFLEQADLILAVGFDAVELIKDWTLEAPVMHIDTLPNTDQVYPAEVELVGHIGAILDALAERARGGAPRWSEGEVASHRDALFERYYSGRVSGKLNPTDVVDATREAVSSDAVVTTDVGSHKLAAAQGWKSTAPRTFLTANGLSAMGFALPGAIAAKLVEPDRAVVCLTGDGGFAMVQSELQVAASLALPILVIVFCDDTLHRIEIKQQVRDYPSTGTRFDPSDVAKLAEAMGCHGVKVETETELRKALENLPELDRPLVVEARIDPAQYHVQF